MFTTCQCGTLVANVVKGGALAPPQSALQRNVLETLSPTVCRAGPLQFGLVQFGSYERMHRYLPGMDTGV